MPIKQAPFYCLAALWAGNCSAALAPLVADAHVSFGAPASNFGALGTVNAGGTSSPGPHRGFLQFNVAAALPVGTPSSQIAKATLILFVNRVNTPGSLNISAAASAWSELAITASSAPAPSTPVGVVTSTVAGTYVSVDATPIVRDWVAGVVPNNGFVVFADPDSAQVSIMFDSKEGTTTSHPAVLDIVLGGAGRGTPGPTGPQGPTGPAGPAGVAGVTGLSLAGPAGAQGPIGPAGSAGVRGATGPAGPAGPDGGGLPGPTGPQGPAGATGTPGPTGSAGPAGTPGTSGPTGPTGPSGPSGPAGVTGPAGAAGAAGPAGVAGPVGPRGATGQTGPAGTGIPGPAGPTGATGASGQSTLVPYRVMLGQRVPVTQPRIFSLWAHEVSSTGNEGFANTTEGFNDASLLFTASCTLRVKATLVQGQSLPAGQRILVRKLTVPPGAGPAVAPSDNLSAQDVLDSATPSFTGIELPITAGQRVALQLVVDPGPITRIFPLEWSCE